MKNLLDEFLKQRTILNNMNFQESKTRISGFLDWLNSNETTIAILAEIENDAKIEEMLKNSNRAHPPAVKKP